MVQQKRHVAAASRRLSHRIREDIKRMDLTLTFVTLQSGENFIDDHNVPRLNKLPEDDSIEVKLENVPVLTDDVKVRFFSSDVSIKLSCRTNKNVQRSMTIVPFSSGSTLLFIEDNRLVLTREELDNPHKKEGQKFYHEKLMVEVLFEDHKEDL
ncbi:TPIP [Mytilus edulis]|uniref:TPTE n=1 Tax=Mytilus edulis TaxID=6550 RepID=A0A8S3RBL5_MYTED|nr:TPIP [Mytilus edulis]